MTPLDLMVQRTGLTVVHLGHQTTEISYGIELRNLSYSRDIDNVTLNINVLTKDGKLASDQGEFIAPQIRVIPAGQTFYVGDTQNLLGAVPAASLRVLFAVGSTPARRYVLPPVANIHIDRSNGGTITATMTNTYSTSISRYDFEPIVVYYDRRGRIVGGDQSDISGGGMIRPGGHATVEFSSFPDGVLPSRVGSVRISVTPI